MPSKTKGRKTSRDAPDRQRRLPSKDEILEFIQSAPDRVGKREIARAFKIRGGDRIELKRLLREMAEDGLIEGSRRRLTRAGALPPVAVIEIVDRDRDGELVATPASWQSDEEGAPPRILVLTGGRMPGPTPGVGDRLLARLAPLDEVDASGCAYEARPIKRLARERERLLGIYHALGRRGGVIDPVDRKQLKEWPVSPDDTGEAEDGELVRFELKRGGRYGLPRARVLERLGAPEAEGAVSLIAIHRHGIPETFPDAVLAEAEALKAPSLGKREDLRRMPLITIDPSDARDHDDAVWAAPDDDPANEGGWVVMVAIADVACHVRPRTALDKEALKRGNSVYFPDRVVPMLPERISNDLCSLREGEDRPCLAVRMTFDKDGRKTGHRFVRGLMRSAAKLAYAQAQAAIDGQPDDTTGPLLEPVLRPLWAAYGAVKRARDRRAPLELDIPERKIVLDRAGRVADVVVPERLDAHKLIEEFMIQANVAAAETLERKRSPLIYRVHDAPSKEKLAALGDFLSTLGIKLPKAGVLKPEQFNKILAQSRKGDMAELVSEVVLRAQAQAEYSPANFGHFGLNLRRYGHFTSPIRRYADLIVHRALIRALGLGEDGLTDLEIPQLDEIASAISDTERRAMAAERETVDRLIAGHLADQVGATFAARISGVVRTGLFVRLATTGADGFVPGSSIGGDFFRQDERLQALVGERTGLAFRLGDQVEVRLVEAIPSAGALRFELLSEGRPLPAGTRRSGPRRPAGRRPRRGRR